MATTVQTPATKAAKRVPMDSLRKTALVAGIFYLITFISIPTLALYGPIKNHHDWILGSGGHTAVLVGGFLEVIVALAGIGTAVTLYPVVKRQNEGAALGFVAARVLEASMIFAGVVSLLSLVTMRQDLGAAAGANTAALVTTGASPSGLPRVFRTGNLRLVYAAACILRYSSWASCGVLYPSAE